jgi:hypothetical protein
MSITPRALLAGAIALLGLTPALLAQPASDPSGHWEGAIAAPTGEVRIELDLARSAGGQLAGTFGQPARKLKGFPLSTVSMKDAVLSFELAAGSNARFQADVAADGRSMSGTFEGLGGPLPFTMTRTGEPRTYAAPTSAAVSKELEGTWSGTISVDGGLRLILKLTNRPDGTSTGVIVSVDQGGFEMPVAIAQKGSALTLDVPMVGATYVAALNERGELVGTYNTAQGQELPLNFVRDGK